MCEREDASVKIEKGNGPVFVLSGPLSRKNWNFLMRRTRRKCNRFSSVSYHFFWVFLVLYQALSPLNPSLGISFMCIHRQGREPFYVMCIYSYQKTEEPPPPSSFKTVWLLIRHTFVDHNNFSTILLLHLWDLRNDHSRRWLDGLCHCYFTCMYIRY